jgi:hypothetical protein
MGAKKIVILLLIFILIVVISITGFFIYKSQTPSTPKSTACPENEDRFYDFKEVQLGNDIIRTLKEGFSFIKNFIRTRLYKEHFALSTGIITLDDIKAGRVSLDPTKQYYRGIRNTTSTITPQTNGGKGCVEYPDVVFKEAPKPVGITSNTNGWTYYKNTNFPNAFKLTTLGDISCASKDAINCLTIQGTTDTDILNSLNAVNSTAPSVCNKYNYTQTPYIGENGLVREIRCNKMVPYLQPYGPNYQESISYKSNVLSNQGPCASYNDDSYKISLDCVKHIWTNLAGCPYVNNDIINYYYNASQNNQMKKASILYDAQAWAYLKDDGHRAACYGTDKTKWPTS